MILLVTGKPCRLVPVTAVCHCSIRGEGDQGKTMYLDCDRGITLYLDGNQGKTMYLDGDQV